MALQWLLKVVGLVEEPTKRKELTDLLDTIADSASAADAVLQLAQLGVMLPWSDMLNLAIATNSPDLLIRLKNDNELWLKRVKIEFPETFAAAYMPSLPFKMRHNILTGLFDKLKFGSTRFSDHSDENPTSRISAWYLLYQEHVRKLRILQKNGFDVDRSLHSLWPRTLTGSFSNILIRKFRGAPLEIYDTKTGTARKINRILSKTPNSEAWMEAFAMDLLGSYGRFNPGPLPRDIVNYFQQLSSQKARDLVDSAELKSRDLVELRTLPFEELRYLCGLKTLKELVKVTGRPSLTGYYDCENHTYQDLRGKKFKLENCPVGKRVHAFSLDPGEPYNLISFWQRLQFDVPIWPDRDYQYYPENQVYEMENSDFLFEPPITFLNGWLTYRQKRDSFFGGYDIKASHIRSLGEAILRGDWRKHIQITIRAPEKFTTVFFDQGLDFGYLTDGKLNIIPIEAQELIGCSHCSIPTEQICEECCSRFCDELCAVGHVCSKK